jgi:hypothetical protein
MYTFDPTKADAKNLGPEWHEPFPEPQTIPSRWDLSEMLSAPASASIYDPSARAED